MATLPRLSVLVVSSGGCFGNRPFFVHACAAMSVNGSGSSLGPDFVSISLCLVSGLAYYPLNLLVGKRAARQNMKLLSIQATAGPCLLVTCALIAAEPVATQPQGTATTNAAPVIAFDSTVYKFDKVMAGESVTHDFVFTNTGSAVLRITGVYPSCGCTTAGEWTKEVEPGKTGVIPLQFNSDRFAGLVDKHATVVCNDKSHPTLQLHLKGSVWRPLEIQPQVAVLNVVSDAPTNNPAVVRITSSLPQPISLTGPRSSNPAFRAELKTVQPGKSYELIIHAVPPLKQGTVQGTIAVGTSWTNMPTIGVTALAVVQPAVLVLPRQVMLPAASGSNAIPYSITIRNNSTHPLTVSDAEVSAPGVAAEVKEVLPGRQFAIMMKFPAGFEIAQGENVELTVKTSNAQFPLIKVPVRQMARPAPGMPRQIRTLRRPAPPTPVHAEAQ